MAASNIKAKIKALRAKTTRAGCTESEALAAAALAAELMRKHRLDETDLVMTEATASEKTSIVTWRSRLSTIIAYCTNTSSIVVADPNREGTTVMFIGRDPGPVIAVYLRDVCFRAIHAEAQSFKVSTFYKRRRSVMTKRQALADFRAGLVERLCTRLVELFGPVRDDRLRDEAKAALQRRFQGSVAIPLRKHKERYSAAGDAGWYAGGAVPLNRGVSTASSPLQIGALRGERP